MDKSRLIAGFFRYHREKLNYSLTGLINDKSIVGESSLCDFENGKRELSESQLKYLFSLIGFDYEIVINSYSFKDESKQIIQQIFEGDGYRALDIFDDCVSKGVFNSLACIEFYLLSFVIDILCKKDSKEKYHLLLKCKHLFNDEQILVFEISVGIYFKNLGNFDESILCLESVINRTYDAELRAWTSYQLGSVYDQIGDYENAKSYIKIAEEIYSKSLNLKKMIQVNLSLGTISMHSSSYKNSEIAYLKAYNAALELKDYKKIVSKCFNSLCWLYFLSDQYDKIQMMLEKKPEPLIESRNTYFVLAWANYKIGNKQETVRLCKEGLEKFKDYTYVCYIYQYIEKAAMNIKTGQESLLKKIVNTEDYDRDKDTEKLFIYELIDFYKRKGDFENACKYYDKLRKKA